MLKTAPDATSLETAQSIVLESTVSEPVEAAAASAAAMPQGSVEQIDADPVPVKEIDEVPVKDDAAPTTIKTANVDPNAAEADAEPLEVLSGSGEPVEAVPAKAAKEKVDVKKTRRKKTPEEVRRERTKRQNAGGTTSSIQCGEEQGKWTRLGEPRQRPELCGARARQGCPQQAVGRRPPRHRARFLCRLQVGRTELRAARALFGQCSARPCGALGRAAGRPVRRAARRRIRRPAALLHSILLPLGSEDRRVRVDAGHTLL